MKLSVPDPTPTRGAPTGIRRLLALAVGSTATPLEQHRAHYAAPRQHGRHDALIALVEKSGLRGRGGAAFPTGTKMRAVASGRRPPIVVVNGTEGEPLSKKDATLLCLQPHLVLDGAALAAHALGATEIIVCVDREQPGAIASVAHAIAERQRSDPQTTVSVSVLSTPPRYVVGEETALVHWINGGEAKPTRTPPRPFERGVRGRPTLVDNVETLAHLAQIAAYGDSWFRSLGTASEPGTALLSLSGALAKPAVYEAPIGYRLATLIDLAEPLHGVGAVLVGGYFGSWLEPPAAAAVRLCNEELRPIGGGLGCGAVAVLPADACGVMESARILAWMAAQTAGQCGACVNGLAAISTTYAKLAHGQAKPSDIALLHRWAMQVDGRGACKFPDGAIRFLRSALRVFGDDLERHARGRACFGTRVPPMLPVPPIRGGWR